MINNDSLNTKIVLKINLALGLYWLNKLKANNIINDNEYLILKENILNKLNVC